VVLQLGPRVDGFELQHDFPDDLPDRHVPTFSILGFDEFLRLSYLGRQHPELLERCMQLVTQAHQASLQPGDLLLLGCDVG
jgi:hypothetical protein